jgi:hypothetical protein
MGTLVFQCPATGQRFDTGFQATRDELKAIPPTATMQLRCEICRGRHSFIVIECDIKESNQRGR